MIVYAKQTISKQLYKIILVFSINYKSYRVEVESLMTFPRNKKNDLENTI